MVQFNTLNSIIDDLMLSIRNGHVAETENISRLQVEQWVHTYRALLIKQDIDKDGDINPEYVQHIDGLQLQVVQESEFEKGTAGCFLLETIDRLPKLLDLNHRDSLLSITDMYGNLIQLGSRTKAKYQSSRKYTCNDYIAFIKNNRLRLEGPNMIEYVNIAILADNPLEVPECGSYDKPYPMPTDKIPVLKELIFQKELGIRLQMRSDMSNDSQDDLTLDRANPVPTRTTRSAA